MKSDLNRLAICRATIVVTGLVCGSSYGGSNDGTAHNNSFGFVPITCNVVCLNAICSQQCIWLSVRAGACASRRE